MEKSFGDRVLHAWSAFRGRSEEPPATIGSDVSFGYRPDRVRLPGYSNKNLITPVLTQVSIDASSVELRHVRTDENGQYTDNMDSELNNCLLIDPNLDQGPTQFRRDVYLTMMETGTVAIVPVETTSSPVNSNAYDIKQLRVGNIVSWYPQHVRVSLYNEKDGSRKELVLPKDMVAIIENPLYSVMNEPNSTLQRLMRKLAQLDITDDRVSSGKLDIILQLPYTIKHETRRTEAKKRRNDLEEQLVGSKYGVGYIDGTERITQLNRPADNQLLEQVRDLEARLYTQMGLTEEIFLGTADEAAMINYHNRTVFPMVQALTEEIHRKFLSRTARTQLQAIQYFRDPFKLVPVSQLAEIADKFTRNEIMAPNEIRPIVGFRPVDDPEADELRNRNMPKLEEPEEVEEVVEPEESEEESTNSEIEALLDQITGSTKSSKDDDEGDEDDEDDKKKKRRPTR